MSSFWPEGIELDDIQSPIEILGDAQEEWKTNSNGIMDLVLQETESKSNNCLIIVHAKHLPSNRTATLFRVMYEPDKPYPARIYPEKNELPDFLKRSYYKPGMADMSFPLAITGMHQGRTISNELVSETPSEFRENLEEVLNLGIVKREILSLLSNDTEVTNNSNEEIQSEESPEDTPEELNGKEAQE